MHWMDWMGGGWMMIFWWVFVIGVVYVVVKFIIPRETRHSEESAIDILKKRYARGEISKEEFNEKKQDLIS